MPGTPEYFVCYSRAQRDFVEKIETKLSRRERDGQLSVWRDVRGLDVWEKFTPVILDVLGRAAGAIVLISDEWYRSPYIQQHEWPTILERDRTDASFQIFPLAFHSLDKDDPLRAHNFVNQLQDERLVGCTDALRDTILTRLSDQVGEHAKTCRDTLEDASGEADADRSAAPEATPTAARGRSTPLASTQGRAAPIGARAAASEPDGGALEDVALRPGLHGVPELPRDFVEPGSLDELCDTIRAAQATAISGLRGEGGTGKSVLAAAAPPARARLSRRRGLGDRWRGGRPRARASRSGRPARQPRRRTGADAW